MGKKKGEAETMENFLNFSMSARIWKRYWET